MMQLLVARTVICLMIFIGSNALAPVTSVAAVAMAKQGVDDWVATHPRAVKEFEEWVISNRSVAQALFRWDNNHPDQSKVFVMWILTHQGKGIDVFAAQHLEWTHLNRIIRENRDAMEDFVVWCRFHPKATGQLIKNRRALYYFGQHLFA